MKPEFYDKMMTLEKKKQLLIKKIGEAEIKVGDKVQWNEHPRVKSEVRIERSGFFEVDMYILKNGCRFQISEIEKVK